jgi:hypothetical protein
MDDSRSSFIVRRVATAGHEILSPQGEVIAWTTDGYWASLIVGLLGTAEREGLNGLATLLRRPADEPQQ